MAHEAGVFFFAFCLKTAGVQKDHDDQLSVLWPAQAGDESRNFRVARAQ